MIFGEKSTQPYTDARWWFAWRPVFLDDGRIVWGRKVWRWWQPGTFKGGAFYEYSLSPEEAVSYYRGLIERSGFYTVGPGAYGQAKPLNWWLCYPRGCSYAPVHVVGGQQING
jgi:hypothetical protein